MNANSLKPFIQPALKEENKDKRIAAATPIETDPRMQIQQSAFVGVANIHEELKILGVGRLDLFPDLQHLAEGIRHSHPPGQTPGSYGGEIPEV